jgi:hypothetical protein
MSPKDEEALEHYQEITKRRMDEVWNPLSPCNVQLEILYEDIFIIFFVYIKSKSPQISIDIISDPYSEKVLLCRSLL